ncbi:MAG: hypothetical protein A2Y62_22305 [Candidatus Fischerbacteria bacterium RBG_13_37_8]|uniref:Sulfatase N-terminal domain-containing protein n=1 Tax=Candidatus Fischerbacteria bacterium RBG_13_37_8 TaxID=1817863 RepID=A0A1F5VLZ4_9BACT|nr:MAG: hypothetical protein A2Y62_22305 [Candidatus Fischerbacteria bacterium RBG_13_37_8]
MRLETRGAKKAKAFWFNPVIYKTEKEPSNIILISVDTLRADHLGCYGYEKQTSPFIDSLAEDSVLFNNTFAASPWTLPSHMSMLTSLYTYHHQVFHKDQELHPSITTFAEILNKNGYYCAAFTDGGFVSGLFGFFKGFDSYRQNEMNLSSVKSAEEIHKKAKAWILENRDKRFFLFLHTYQPHDPYCSPPPYNSMFLDDHHKLFKINLGSYLGGIANIYKPLSEEERQNIIALYDAEIRYTDEALVDALIKDLKELDLYQQSMIIFTSDHGEEFYEHQGWTHGYSLYDESLRVPLIIKFPGNTYRGKRIKQYASTIDIVPTVLSILDIPYEEYAFDGMNLLEAIEGKTLKGRTIISDVAPHVLDFHNPKRIAMYRGTTKVIYNENYLQEDLTFYTFPPPLVGTIEAFELSKDSHERKNIASSQKKLIDALLHELLALYPIAQPSHAGKAVIDEELQEQLKALGYVQH